MFNTISGTHYYSEMDELLEKPAEPEEPQKEATLATQTKLSWREYFETEEATRTAYLVFAFIAIAMLMSFLQFRTDAICCGDWDGYYHIKTSMLLWQSFSSGHWLPTFEWLPLTVLNPADYNDHHFLFHLLQIPFLWFLKPVMAAKVSAVVFSTLAIFSVYWILHRYKIGYPLIWLAGILTCSNMFFYRMNMAKAPPLTIVITVIGIHLLFQRKYIWLLPLMFAFVWTYSLFPLLWMASIIWVGVIAWNERKFEWKPLVYTTSGMILGNLINPYFPNNLLLFYEHFITKFKVGADFAVAVGGEWYPFSGMELLTNLPIAMAAMLIGYILFMPRGKKLPEKATFFLVFATILLAAQFRSKRFAEYFPPFAVLFAAFSWNAFMTSQHSELPEDFRREIEPYLDAPKKTDKEAFWDNIKLGFVWSLGIVLIITFLINLVGLQRFGIEYGGLIKTISSNEANDRYERAMTWATGTDDNGNPNIPPGEIIFNCNWDDFPKLFFYNTQNRYVYGLDPNYLYSENPDLFNLLQSITKGDEKDAGPKIREKFGSRFVFADAKENLNMTADLLSSGWAETVYEDDEARILKIREVKGRSEDPTKSADAPETEEEGKQLDAEEANDAANSVNDNDEKQ